ncbi:unnamed protein product [Calicophoron daubneyi]|uniref:Uncharacterized protein n=1 Tax=Calicophoron daubneyi TaxID=300641 RepID=A0AAV2TK04_CALDB
MPSSRNPRRSSAKACLEALSKLAKKTATEADDEPEVDSNEEDSLYKCSGEQSEAEDEDDESSDLASLSSDALETPSEEGSERQRRNQKSKQRPVASHSTPGRSITNINSGLLNAMRNLVKNPINFAGAVGKQDQISYAPIIKYLLASRILQLRTIREMAVGYFSKSLDKLRTSDEKVHPFNFNYRGFRDEFEVRQSALFPTNLCWKPYLNRNMKTKLPLPSMSPFYSVNSPDSDNSNPKRLKRFEFDRENGLLYLGGYVRSLAWCPPPTCGDTDKVDTAYLAVTTHSTPNTHVFYSDPFNSDPGLLQIWNCGELGLSHEPADWSPRSHIFIVHDWGQITDMCWLPIPVSVAANITNDNPDYIKPIPIQAHAVPSVRRILGHLITACHDGFVRIFAVPRFDLDPMYFGITRDQPFYSPNDKSALRLSVSPKTKPPWIGWPTCVHIRAEYPDRLFVGYTTGHVGYYQLGCLNPQLFTASEVHLAPVRLFRLIKGPVTSMALNHDNGRMLLAQGLDLSIRIWDIEDTVSLTVDSPELQWVLPHGLLSPGVLWPNRGNTIFYGRETIFNQRVARDAQGKPVRDLSEMVVRSDNLVCQTFIEAPNECLRHLMPLGIQSLSSMDFSDPLNALLCATDRGRLEAIMHTLDGRIKEASKKRYLGQLRLPLCQWTMERLESVRVKSEEDTIADSVMHKYIANATEKTVDPEKELEQELRDSCCPDCKSDRCFCWHKLWKQYRLVLHTRDLPDKPYMDYIKTPLLRLSQVRFCPNPGSATWIAVATAFGFVQFIHVPELYLRDFDDLLNRTPEGKDSPCLSAEQFPSDIPMEVGSIWNTPKSAKADLWSSNQKTKKKKRTKPHQTASTETPGPQKVPTGKRLNIQLPESSQFYLDDGSTVTEPMNLNVDALLLSSGSSSSSSNLSPTVVQNVVARRSKRKSATKKRNTDPDSDSTIPCTQSPR